MKRLLACLSATLFLLGPVSQAQTPRSQSAASIVVPPFQYQERTLPNGLKLVTSVDHSVPL
ncbi:MAG TPA: hypothetical protein VHV47_09210, partial [Opitutaceae bacterium]|nr:hypothetical protein [Opitutaceae bacterium]